jgi:UDP-glucose 4-epimerase
MRIVVTGALGHIGSRVINDLPNLFSNMKIVMIDNMLTQRYPSLFSLSEKGRYCFKEADVTCTDLNTLIDGSSAVLHLAAITDATRSFENSEQVENVNYNATVRVAEACKETNVPMIHLSSTSVYGTQKEVVDENCTEEELQPQSPYAKTKLKEEDFLMQLGKSNEFRFIICRFGTIYGVSPGIRFHTAVNKFCWQAVLGQPLTVWRTALYQKRPYLDLSDAVSAIAHIIRKDLFDNNTYNVLTENLTVKDITDSIRRYVPDLNIEFVDTPIMNQLSYEVLNAKFKKTEFDFNGNIDEGIRNTIRLLGRLNVTK